MLVRIAHIFVIFVAAALCACGDSATQRRLDRAAALVETDPATALAICDSIADPEALSDANRASYGYVSSLACLSSGIGNVDEQQLEYAARYYGRASHKDNIMLARVYFMLGLCDIQAGDYASASANTVRARYALGNLDDYVWLGRIERQLADLSSAIGDYDQAIDCTRAAINAFDNAGMATHAQYEQISLARKYCEAAVPVEALNCIDSIFSDSTEFLGSNRTFYLATKAEILSELGRYDDAEACLNAIPDSIVYSFPYDIAQTAIVVNSGLGRFHKADSIISLIDSAEPLWKDDRADYISTRYLRYLLEGDNSRAISEIEKWMDVTNIIERDAGSIDVRTSENILLSEENSARQQRIRDLKVWLLCLCIILVLSVVFAIVYNKERKTIYRLEIERNMSDIDTLRTEIQKLRDDNIIESGAEIDILNKLLCELEAKSVNKSQLTMDRLYSIVSDFFSGNNYKSIEKLINQKSGGIVFKLRGLEIGIGEDDIRMLVLKKYGLTTNIIGRIMGIAPQAMRTRRSRIKNKIAQTDSKFEAEIMTFFFG